MKILTSKQSRRFLLIICLFLLLGGGALPVLASRAPNSAAQSVDSFTPPPVYLIADPEHSDLKIGPPAGWDQPHLTSAADIVVDFVPAGGASFFPGITCSTFPANAQAAMLYAASIWESVLTSNVPIHVQACWSALDPGILGGAGATYVYWNFPGGQANTKYALALANTLANTDLNSAPEIWAVFNSAFPNFYFGTDGNPGSAYDFASVALHEIAHGLGFFGSMDVYAGNGSWGDGGYPVIYDRFAQDGNGTPLLSYANNSAALASALQGGANGVYFSGLNANAANGGNRVKLYSPPTWQFGSSYAHVDTIYDYTVNALMTFSLRNGEVVHAPGPISVGILKDLGWVIPPPSAPTSLNLSVISSSQINLSWTDTSGNETGFKVERSTDGLNWTQIATPGLNATSFPNTGLLSGTRYYYRLRAYNDVGNSAYSNTANAITQGPPQLPGSPSAFPAGLDRIWLSWTDASNIESGYLIQRSPDGSTGWVDIYTAPANATGFHDSGLSLGTQYFYQIKTQSSTNGDSAFSSVISATTWTVSYQLYSPLIRR